jgi:hypothetical protein
VKINKECALVAHLENIVCFRRMRKPSCTPDHPM